MLPQHFRLSCGNQRELQISKRKPEAPLVAFLKNCRNRGVNILKEDVESDRLQFSMTMEMQTQLEEK